MIRHKSLSGLLAALILSGTCMSAPLKTLQGHALTLDVKVAGQQVMASMIELVADTPAAVEMVGSKPGERYSLHLLLKDGQRAGQINDAVAIEAQLFGGDSKSQELLSNMTIFIRPGQGGNATIESERGAVEIHVLSHAVRTHAMPEAE